MIDTLIRNLPKKMAKHAPLICKFCTQSTKYIDYKNVRVLRRYVQSSGQMQPSRYSGVCSGHQRHLANAIKRARMVALLPFVR